LNARIVTDGAGPAYAAVTVDASRLHRSGFMPLVGSRAIRAWLDANATGMTATTGAVGCSNAADLGYSYGTYDLKGGPSPAGAYIRVWQRNRTGKWLVVADVVQKM